MLVIYGHSYSLTAHAAGQMDWIAWLMPGFYAGSLAVFVFFAISGFILALPFAEAAFDVVVAQYVITAVPDPEATLDEFARVTRPGGDCGNV